MNLFLWYLLVNIVEVLGHIPRPHRCVLATLAPDGIFWLYVNVLGGLIDQLIEITVNGK